MGTNQDKAHVMNLKDLRNEALAEEGIVKWEALLEVFSGL